MDYKNTIDYIHSVSNYFCKPGLERIRVLCEKLGNPQDKLKFIHVAGTNGKGSFCAMLSNILKSSGYKTGLYTSPYIIKFNERISINGEMISDNDLVTITTYVKNFVEDMEDKPTEFEIITAIAFEYFYRNKCDYVVLECGLGGKFDATNIISTSVLSVITGVSIDHTNFLGNSINEIAGEKAGIIKSNVSCLWCGESKIAREIIESAAKKNNSPFYVSHKEGLKIKSSNLDGTIFDYNEYTDLYIKLLGEFQPYNAANVISATEILKNIGIVITEKNIRDGLINTVWRARFELISDKPVFIFDGGHNEEGIEAAVHSVKRYFSDKKLCVITGVMKDKDYTFIAKKIAEISEKVFCVTPDNPRALTATAFSKVFDTYNINSEAYENINDAVFDAINTAKNKNLPILAVGSLYMYNEIIESLSFCDKNVNFCKKI